MYDRAMWRLWLGYSNLFAAETVKTVWNEVVELQGCAEKWTCIKNMHAFNVTHYIPLFAPL